MSDTFKHNAFTAFFSDTRSDKAAPHDSINPESSSSKESVPANNKLAEINARISERTASLVQYNAQRQRFSKRINLANSNEHVAAVCDYTGAVVAITFPSIPGRVFSYSSPLADLRNARGLAQEGKDYLRKLDIQTAAAVLITLADDYSLFRYQPSDSGAQKNAILRTVAKDILIDSILFIEEFINSNNCNWIPRLSLILSEEIIQGGIQHRMQEWLKVSLDAVYKPDEESYEDAATRSIKENRSYAHKPVTNAATKRTALALQKDFRQWKRESKDIIIGMSSDSTISPKLKGFLLTLISDQNLMLADNSNIALICEKLNQIDSKAAKELAAKIVFFRAKLLDSEESEFSKPATETFSALSPGQYVGDSKAEDNEFAAPTATLVAAVSAAPTGPVLSFKERIMLLKAQQAAASSSSNVQTSKVENDDAPF